MSGATATKVVWFGEGWDELEQRLAHRACVKWHVLFLLPIVSAFRVSQSPDKMHAMMREELIRRNDVVSKPQGRQGSHQLSIFPCRDGDRTPMEEGRPVGTEEEIPGRSDALLKPEGRGEGSRWGGEDKADLTLPEIETAL